MSDGVRLAADLYTPAVPSKGVVLIRSPYGRKLMALSDARVLAGQGYTVLLASSRGTAGSEGVFRPMMDEAADGQDVIAWLRQQPWYPGRFATYGHSYLGYTQWALLSDPPEDMAAAVVLQGPHDFSRAIWGNGAFSNDHLRWVGLQSTMERFSPAAVVSMLRGKRPVDALCRAVPVLPAADAHFAATAPWLHSHMSHPDLSDPFWAPMQHSGALETSTVPVLVIAGWQDLFLAQSIEQYTRLHERGVDVRLVIGAWSHVNLDHRIASPVAIRWLDAQLGRAGTVHTGVDVEVTPTGAWIHLESWPPADCTPITFYPHPAGALTHKAPINHAERSFVFDPADPTPSIGGNHLAGGNYQEDSELSKREDLLCFETDRLDEDLLIMGRPKIRLWHRTERPDCDVFVRISDVAPDGRSTNVTDGNQRFRGDRASIAVDMLDIAHVFRAGHRVRLTIAGGAFPAFSRNPGSGENPLEAPQLHANRHTVELGPGSSLTLPTANAGHRG